LTFTLSGVTGTGMITLRATDASNAFVEDTFQLTVTTAGGTPQLVNVIRINSGGAAQNFGGEMWAADQYFTGGTPYSTTSAIANTTQDEIYQSERYGNFTYAIPVASAGTYAVDLHLAEIYFNVAGLRVFNVNIENGQFVRNNLDLIQTIGAINQAYVLRADNLNITDGVINITVTTVVDNAKLSGISVGKYDTAPTNTAPVVAQAYPDQNLRSTQASLAIPLGQIFNDNGGVNNLTFTVANTTNAGLISNTTITGTQLNFTLSGVTGTGIITLRATDASNAFVEDAFQLTVTSGTPNLTTIIRINSAGGPQNYDGEIWVGDQYNSIDGGGITVGDPIGNTTKDEIYQSALMGTITYNIPVPAAGRYAVDLHFAETLFNAAGSRIFNVNVENGQFVKNNLDLFEVAGFKQAYVLWADSLNITDGAIRIDLSTVQDNAWLAGVVVSRYEVTPTNTPPLVLSNPEPKILRSTESGFVIQLDELFTDDAGFNNLAISITGNSNATLISGSQRIGNQLTFALTGAIGRGSITLRATDAQNTFVESNLSLEVIPGGSEVAEIVARINSGGPAANFNGENWSADQFFTGGETYATTTPIGNTEKDQIYQSERFGTFSYAIPVAQPGTYSVDFHFAEIYFTTPNSRLFDINVENAQFTQYRVDLIERTGGLNQAYILRADNLVVTDGVINITFTSVKDYAKLSGIEVGLLSTFNPPPFVVQTYADQTIPSTQTSLEIPLNQIFNDNSGFSNLSFAVVNNTNAALINNVAVAQTQMALSLTGATGTGMITIRATDAQGAFIEDTFQLTITAGQAPQLVNVIRINSGGGAQNFGGEVWSADQHFISGSTYSTTSAISNTTNDPIYQSERYGSFGYNIPVSTAGTYVVDLHFAEIYFTTAGSRTFNINIENGQFVRNSLDLIQTTGSINQAYVLRVDNLNVTDGMINIMFTRVTDNAKISGIAISRYTTGGTAARSEIVSRSPIVDGLNDITLYEGQSWNYQVVASDPDGEKLSYASKNLPASLFLDRTTGLIKGTIEANAVKKDKYPVTIKVSDQSGLTTEVNFNVIIAAKDVKSESVVQEFVVYPNPTDADKDEVSVRVDSRQQDRWNFSLLDFTGKTINLGTYNLEEGVHEITFDLLRHHLSPGLYYLAAQNRDGKKVIKVGIKLRPVNP
jgi:hypothetical protein